MAVYRDRPCPMCDGRGFVTIMGENSIGCSGCEECHNTGMVLTAITNNERLNELTSPEDKLKVIRGFQRWAKYAGNPLRLIYPEENDAEMLEWLNKISDENDNFIFENK